MEEGAYIKAGRYVHQHAECAMAGEETLSHIVGECEKTARIEYKKKHEKMLQLIHWNLWGNHK